jgi:hypothetical protein
MPAVARELLASFSKARVVTAIVLGCMSLTVSAQRASDPGTLDESLPNAPVSLLDAEQQADPSSHHDSASISGAVQDATGAVVPRALVTLQGPAIDSQRTMESAADGSFTFSNLPTGKYRITVVSAGLGSYVSQEIELGTRESREVPRVVLPIAPTNVDVRVNVTEAQLATEQVKLQEQQRVLGLLPNFYTSYVWDAAPMTTKLKFNLALKSATDPVTFLGAGFIAGVEQANNSFPGYGQEAGGYGQRLGAAYADDVIARMLGSAIFPSLMKQDPRYFYRGSGSTKSRLLYALAATFVCKGDNGHWQPAYSYFAGSFGAGAIATLYHPSGTGTASLVLRNGLIDTGGHALNNVVREFLLRKLTPKVPDYAQGKP